MKWKYHQGLPSTLDPRPPIPVLRHWKLVELLMHRPDAPRVMRDEYIKDLHMMTMAELRTELARVEKET